MAIKSSVEVIRAAAAEQRGVLLEIEDLDNLNRKYFTELEELRGKGKS